MYENLEEKYENSVFQFLKICKLRRFEHLAISNLIGQLEKNILGCAMIWKLGQRKVHCTKNKVFH